MAKHISCDCKRKSNSTTFNSNLKWNNKTCKSERKCYHKYKKIIFGILPHVFARTANVKKYW